MQKDKRRCLVTGITGQTGSYLTELLLEKDYEVHGLIRRHSNEKLEDSNIGHLLSDVKLDYGDLTDPISLQNAVIRSKPHEVYALGAQSVSADSLCPILQTNKICHKTLEQLWNSQVASKKKVHIENVDGLEVEVIDAYKTNIKALGYTNGMGSWFRIKQISRHKYEGPIAEMRQKYGSIKVTPNHSILDQNQAVRLPAENPWLLNVRKLNYSTRRKNDFYKLSIRGKYEYDENHLWLAEKGEPSKLLRKLNKEQLKSYLIFIGAFIAEGSTCYNINNKNYYIDISEQNTEWLKEIQTHLNNFFDGKSWIVRHKKENHKDVFALSIKSRVLYNHLREVCGIGSYNKKIPDEVFQLDPELISLMFNKMVEGDGCYEKSTGYFRYTTASYHLACQLSLLFSILGYDYTVNQEDNIKYNHTYWHFRQCKTYAYDQGLDGKQVKYSDYNGYVYDISVDEVNNFTVGVGNIVVHNSHVHISYDNPIYTANVVALGHLNLLEAVRMYAKGSRVVHASTSEMFGNEIDSDGFQRASTSLRPANPYACAKVFAHNIGINYRNAYQMFIANSIAMNHESPRRGGNFVTSKVVREAVRISKGLASRLPLGCISARRDWGHAKDTAKAIWLMLQHDSPDDWMVSTQINHSVEELCDYVFSKLGLNYKDYVVIDPKFIRPEETRNLRGDSSKIRSVLGWKPEYTFESLMDEMIEHYQKIIK